MFSYPVVSDKMLNTSLIFQDSIMFIKHNCGNTFVSEIAAFLDNFFKSSFFILIRRFIRENKKLHFSTAYQAPYDIA